MNSVTLFNIVNLGRTVAIMTALAGSLSAINLGSGTISINGTEPLTSTQRLFRDGNPSTWANPKPAPASIACEGGTCWFKTVAINPGGMRFIRVTITNASPLPSIFVSAYNGTFNIANLATNYLADGGSSGVTAFQVVDQGPIVLVFNSIGNIGLPASIDYLVEGFVDAQGNEPEFQVRYASNLTSGDAVINLTNTGANGAALNGPGFGGAAGNVCVNVYAFSPDEQLVSCCSCLITPNGLVSLSVNSDLISNTLTGVRPNSVVVKVVTTGASANFTGTSCTNSAALANTAAFPLATGVLSWGTTVHAAGTGFATTETPFSKATLSLAELASITNRCMNIIGNGSTFGICRSCRTGGLNASN